MFILLIFQSLLLVNSSLESMINILNNLQASVIVFTIYTIFGETKMDLDLYGFCLSDGNTLNAFCSSNS